MSNKIIYGMTVVVGVILAFILSVVFDASRPAFFIAGLVVGAAGYMVAYAINRDEDK